MENKGTIAIIIGALLLMVNVGIGVTGTIDGIIEGTVADTVAGSYDGLDDDGNQDYTADFDDDWINASSEKAYFGNSITNLEEILADATVEPTYEMLGPFIYYENTTREVIEFDYDEGSITYSGYETFEWCEDCTWVDDDGVEHDSLSGDTVVNQINILWNTQRIAGMGSGIEYGEIFAKAMFAAQMIEFDLSNRAPSIWASEDIGGTVDAAGGGKFGNMNAELNISAASYSATGQTNIWTIPDDHDLTPIKTAFYTANDGYGNCIALTCDIGPVLIAGMGAPSDTVTPARAALLGYSDWTSAVEDTVALDWAIYSLAASKFVEHGGGAEINNQTPQLKERFAEVSGLTISDPSSLENLLFNESVGMLTSFEISGIPLPGMVVGLLLPLQSADYFGAMTTYNVGLLTIAGLADYVEPWVGLGLTGAPTEFELILAGGQGTMASNDWWLTAFGDYDPLGGIYIPIGLNRDSFAGMAELTQEQSDFILNDPEIGLKSSFPGPFMYGELSGLSLPDAEGVQHVWDDAYVANLYGITEDAAHALRDWVANFYFDTVMPVLLNFVTGNTPYYSMPISNWLYGWDDAVSAYFGFFSWNSLETNATYYGSDGISTGDWSVFKMSTKGDTMGQRMAQGYINSDGNGLCDFDYDDNGDFIGYDLACEDGQVYGMTEHLTWRAPHREEGANGLLTDHAGNSDTSLMGTAGSLASPNDPFSFNVAGYAVATSEVGSKTTYKGIDMVEHTVTVEPTNTQIQGKLIGSSTYVDVIPGALPVYLGADIDLKVEPVTTAIMYGKVKVTFHLDTRGPGFLNPDLSENSTESMPVFEIHVFSEIDDEGAKDFTGAVSDNLGPMGWTNFGGTAGTALTAVHTVVALMYVTSIASLAYGLSDPSTRAMLGIGKDDDDE
ncbi:MAG: hypothetical protein ACJZ42_02025 [Candidatus Thalassarchaeaceae archaeon]|nr:MAG: hypothetical protein CND84_02950 [Marine Group II euryarchaeote MED-G35]